jgi:kynurenine formamidase
MDIASIPLEQLIAPCIVIDVSARAHENYRVTPDDIRHFETTYGPINKKSFVIIYTAWDKFWNNKDEYRNNLIFPTISSEATELLLERDIVGLGIDTLSPDNEADGFPVHRLVLGSGKYIIENIANAGLMPPVGAYTFALPIKIQDGAESPIRLIAITTPT